MPMTDDPAEEAIKRVLSKPSGRAAGKEAAVEFDGFDISRIQQVRTVPDDYFAATVEVRFREKLGEIHVGQTVSVTVRVIHKADATFASLEQKLFDDAKRLLNHAALLFQQETAVSLRQRDQERRDGILGKPD